MTAEPSITVEIDFSGVSWDSSDPNVWTDITEYVQAINPKRGRDNEIGSIEAGTMDLTLDNTDGRFTPERANSPYYPYVKPRRPVRAYAVLEGVEYPLFGGVTGSFPATTDAGATDVTISCVDVTTPLSKKRLMNPLVYELTSGGYSLVELFKMNDGPNRFAGTVDPVHNFIYPTSASTNDAIVAAGGDKPALITAGDSIVNSVGAAVERLPENTGLGSAGVSGTSKKTIQAGNGKTPVTSSGIALVSTPFPLAPTSSGGDFTVSMFFKMDKAPAGDAGLVCRIENIATGESLVQVLLSPGVDYYGYYRNTDATNNVEFFTNVPDTDPFMEDWTRLGVANFIQVGYAHSHDTGAPPCIMLSVNGIARYTPITGHGFLSQHGNYRLIIGSLLQIQNDATSAVGDSAMVGCDFHVEMVSIHNQILSGLDVAALAIAASGNSDFFNTPAERIGYFLDQLGWPADKRNLDATDDGTRVLFINWEGTPDTLTELRAPALDANGVLFVGPDGKVTYQSRRKRVNPIPKFTFTEGNGTGADGPLQWEMSEDDIVNIAEIDNAYGVKTTLRNEGSITEFGESSVSITTRLASDEEAIQSGYWQINRHGDAQLRLDGITLNPTAQSDGSLWLAVCSLEISDCIALNDLPDSAPDEGIGYFVESISHDIARNGERLEWTTELQVSPAANHGGWILGSPSHGVLGVTTTLYY